MAKPHAAPDLPKIRDAAPEDFSAIEQFLLETVHLYPGIDTWWRRKVSRGIEAGQRIVLVAEHQGRLDGLFIGKKGEHAKLCTLRVRNGSRGNGVGRALAAEGLFRLVDERTKDVHVTISEATEEGCTDFFENFGFHRILAERDRYVRGLVEWVYRSTARNISRFLNLHMASFVNRALWGVYPQFGAERDVLLFSLKPEFGELFAAGKKSVEFRRQFSQRYVGSQAIFYLTSPVCQFALTARIAAVTHARNEDLWASFKNKGGISKKAFDTYFQGRSRGYAIALAGIGELRARVDLDDARAVSPGFRPPQSFQRIPSDSPLTEILECRDVT